jgi:hypothetical protein
MSRCKQVGLKRHHRRHYRHRTAENATSQMNG